MSLEADFIASLTLIQTNLYRFGGPLLICVGTVSCIISLTVFTKKHLRKNPCSIYLVAYNVSNLLFIYTSLLFSTLLNGYNITPSSYNLSFCHFRYYTMILFDVLCPSYIILASVDRVLVTSRNVVTRRRSTFRLAYIGTISITLFWMLAHSHTLVFTNIIQPAPSFVVCYFQPGIYSLLMSYYTTIVKGIVVPSCMIILGVWTVKNIRYVSRVGPAPVVTTTRSTGNGVSRSTHRKDRQLIRILLIDISIYIIFSLMISIVLMRQQFTQSQSQSLIDAKTQSFLLSIGVFNGYIPYCVGCYTNLLVSKTFRHEVKKVIMCK